MTRKLKWGWVRYEYRLGNQGFTLRRHGPYIGGYMWFFNFICGGFKFWIGLL